MFILKLSNFKNLFFSLITVAILGVLVTSCEREAITTVLEETENISEEKLPISPQELLEQAETSNDIESRSCKFNGCKYYISSLTLNQVKASSKAPYKIYVYYYNVSGGFAGWESFTPLNPNCSILTYNLNPPANTCRASAFVHNSSACGVTWSLWAC